MFYNTKIRSLFVMIYVLQHIFNRYLNFIDLGIQAHTTTCRAAPRQQ